MIDGHIYEGGETIPDLGSLECIGYDKGKREYQGLSGDADKLPVYDDLATGSSAMMVDTGEFYLYQATTRTWYLQ